MTSHLPALNDDIAKLADILCIHDLIQLELELEPLLERIDQEQIGHLIPIGDILCRARGSDRYIRVRKNLPANSVYHSQHLISFHIY